MRGLAVLANRALCALNKGVWWHYAHACMGVDCKIARPPNTSGRLKQKRWYRDVISGLAGITDSNVFALLWDREGSRSKFNHGNAKAPNIRIAGVIFSTHTFRLGFSGWEEGLHSQRSVRLANHARIFHFSIPSYLSPTKALCAPIRTSAHA